MYAKDPAQSPLMSTGVGNKKLYETFICTIWMTFMEGYQLQDDLLFVPITMVQGEHGALEIEFSLQIGHFPLP